MRYSLSHITTHTQTNFLHSTNTPVTSLTRTVSKYPIPNPQGGKNAKNLVLREDQQEYQRALRAHRKQKTVDIFDPDYVPNLLIGASPPAAVGPPIIGYGKRNPNERRGRGKSNRKK